MHRGAGFGKSCLEPAPYFFILLGILERLDGGTLFLPQDSGRKSDQLELPLGTPGLHGQSKQPF